MSTLLAENSADQHETLNRMFGTTVIALSDANKTLTDVEAQYGTIVFTGSHTASRDVIYPAEARSWDVENNTGQNLVHKISAGTGVTQSTGTWIRINYNSNAADIEQATV